MPLTKLRISTLLLAVFVGACWFVAIPSVCQAEQAGSLDFANTYAVIVGVLHWEDKGLTAFPPEHRKDQELYDMLRKRGVPADNMALLLDERATLANIRKELQTIAAKAKPDSTLIFYYAGHGWRMPTGTAAFANYDYSAKKANHPGFEVREIGDILVEKKFQGARVLLLADCCHSGGLQDVVRNLAKAKIKAAALTSADIICFSTGSWIFTQTIIDGFAGDPFLDADGDGSITLGELAAEVSRAMQFRERQRYCFVSDGIAANFKLAPTNREKKLPEAIKGAFALKEYVTARDNGKQRPGRIVGFHEEKYAVEFYSYTEKEVVLLPASALSKIKYKTYKIGEGILVARAGMPKATILEVAGDFHRVAYPGQRGRGEEWLLSDRIVEDSKSAAEVNWKGEWIPAIVLETKEGKYRIHYAGFDDSWDEWVTKERIRFPGKARNPFNVEDVADPIGEDLKQFASKVKLPGGADDKNAAQWVKKETEGKKGALDGDWSGRWEGGAGTAQVQVVKDRVYILYTEGEGMFKGKGYLLEAVREKDRLVGRWMTLDNTAETGPFVGLIVNDEPHRRHLGRQRPVGFPAASQGQVVAAQVL